MVKDNGYATLPDRASDAAAIKESEKRLVREERSDGQKTVARSQNKPS